MKKATAVGSNLQLNEYRQQKVLELLPILESKIMSPATKKPLFAIQDLVYHTRLSDPLMSIVKTMPIDVSRVPATLIKTASSFNALHKAVCEFLPLVRFL